MNHPNVYRGLQLKQKRAVDHMKEGVIYETEKRIKACYTSKNKHDGTCKRIFHATATTWK